ncbi:MAG: ABC transporter permease subunit [Thermomicrobiales bacterium]
MSTSPLLASGAPLALTRPGELHTLLLIARRGAIESLRDRMTLILSLFFALVFPIAMVLAIVRPVADSPDAADTLGFLIALYFLLVGLLPSSAAIGSACGQFAGEKEQGNLTPILASPASNIAIFGGKVLGAALPSLFFSVVAEVAYLGTMAVVVGPDRLRLIPPALAIAMLALVPIVTTCAATVASLVSSRVRTFNAAQQISGLLTIPLWAVIIGLAVKLRDWGTTALVVTIVSLAALDILLIVISARTWRREEVLAQR